MVFRQVFLLAFLSLQVSQSASPPVSLLALVVALVLNPRTPQPSSSFSYVYDASSSAYRIKALQNPSPLTVHLVHSSVFNPNSYL